MDPPAACLSKGPALKGPALNITFQRETPSETECVAVWPPAQVCLRPGGAEDMGQVRETRGRKKAFDGDIAALEAVFIERMRNHVRAKNVRLFKYNCDRMAKIDSATLISEKEFLITSGPFFGNCVCVFV